MCIPYFSIFNIYFISIYKSSLSPLNYIRYCSETTIFIKGGIGQSSDYATRRSLASSDSSDNKYYRSLRTFDSVISYGSTLLRFLLFLIRARASNKDEDDAEEEEEEEVRPKFRFPLSTETTALIDKLLLDIQQFDIDEINHEVESDGGGSFEPVNSRDVEKSFTLLFEIVTSVINVKHSLNIDQATTNMVFLFLANCHIKRDGSGFDLIHLLTSTCAHLMFIFKGVVLLRVRKDYKLASDDTVEDLLAWQKDLITYVVVSQVNIMPCPFSNLVDIKVVYGHIY
jgi:hypothetical protein